MIPSPQLMRLLDIVVLDFVLGYPFNTRETRTPRVSVVNYFLFM